MKIKKTFTIISILCVISAISVGCTGGTSSETDSSTPTITESTKAAEAPLEESSQDESSQDESSQEESTEKKIEEISEVLYEDASIRITYTGLDTEDWLGNGLKVTVENLSDKNITVQTRESSVNGVMEDPYFSCDVAAGKTANDSIVFSSDNELGVVEMSFHIFDADTYDTIVDTDTITVTVDESVSSEKANATVVYESNGIKVSYAGIEEDEIWGTEFNFVIENSGSETYAIVADNISIDGVMHDGTLYAEVAAGKYANESMSFIGDDTIPEDMSKLEFTIRITNSNYETVAESDPIQIDLN